MNEHRFETSKGGHNWLLGPKLVVVMVGLPARGKSYITEKLARYLNWLQYETQVFNAGKNRRSRIQKKVRIINTDCEHSANSCLNAKFTAVPLTHNITQTVEKEISHPASFFDPNNSEALCQREEIALSTLKELLDWILRGDGCVGIFDATNSTTKRRKVILDEIRQRGGSQLQVLFLESCCYDSDILEKNLHLKLSGPDYRGQESKKALADFRQRITEYEKSYVPLGDFEECQKIPYLKLIDVGSKVIAYGINGLLPGRVVEYLLNFHLFNRRIWITRNGESLDDAFGKIGRHSPLSENGRKFANALEKFIESHRNVSKCHNHVCSHTDTPMRMVLGQENNLNPRSSLEAQKPTQCRVWTSMMTQAIHTSHPFDKEEYEVRHLKALDDLNAGSMEGWTFAQIEDMYPEEMARRKKDPLRYRWPGPGGEGYADIINRLRPLIIELERSRDDLVLITHRAVVRVLLAYFQNLGRENLAEIQVPLGKIFAVTPQPYGVVVETYRYNERTDQFELDPNP